MFIIVYFLTLWTAECFIGTAEVFGMVFSAIVCNIEVKVSSSSFIPTTVSGLIVIHIMCEIRTSRLSLNSI